MCVSETGHFSLIQNVKAKKRIESSCPCTSQSQCSGAERPSANLVHVTLKLKDHDRTHIVFGAAHHSASSVFLSIGPPLWKMTAKAADALEALFSYFPTHLAHSSGHSHDQFILWSVS